MLKRNQVFRPLLSGAISWSSFEPGKQVIWFFVSDGLEEVRATVGGAIRAVT